MLLEEFNFQHRNVCTVIIKIQTLKKFMEFRERQRFVNPI